MEEVKRGKVTAPEKRAERIIKKCLKREISRKMPQIITTGHVLEGIAELDEEADSIGQTAASHAEQMLPWLEVVSCEVTLEVLDLDESILEKENYRWRQKEAESAEQRAMQMRLVEKSRRCLDCCLWSVSHPAGDASDCGSLRTESAHGQCG